MLQKTDLLIIGGGPAGLAAAIYAGRAQLDALLLDRGTIGGQIIQTNDVENYPGAVQEESGASLAMRMTQQAERFGVRPVIDQISSLELEGPVKRAKGLQDEYEAKAVILATGTRPRLLGCPGEREFTGRGVSYCATCDGMFYRGGEVFVIGGGDMAVEESVFLTRFVRKVHIVHRRGEFRAAASLIERAKGNEKIDLMMNTVLEEIGGDQKVGRLTFKRTDTGEIFTVEGGKDGPFGVFVMIGQDPITELFPASIKDERGYVTTDEEMQTALPGVFAAGDLRAKKLRQVVTATADGAIAATAALEYIEHTGHR